MADVTAELGFLSPTSPYPSFTIQEMGKPAIRDGAYAETEVFIADARALSPEPSLDSYGFQLVRFDSQTDFGDETSIKNDYYSEASDLATSILGAEHAFVIDHTIRTSTPSPGMRSVVTHVHNDYTPRSANDHASRIAHENGLPGSFRIVEVNIWKPLTEPVLMSPLALADGSTVRREDLIRCPVIYPDRTGEIFELKHHPDQRWYWYPLMMTHEALIFKGYDSQLDQCVRFVPHTAFHHPNTNDSTPERRSIEIRILAFICENEEVSS